MGWLDEGWKKLSGQNQKVGLGTIGSEWDTAYGGLEKDYGWLQQQGQDMMDPNSAMNRQRLGLMQRQAADTSAEGTRLGGRLASMAGGAPAGVLAQQAQSGVNKATAGTIDSFNQYLGQQYSGGAGMMSGAMANIGQLRGGRMNMMQNQRLANAQIDTNAMGQGLGMLGGLGQMAFGMPPTMMMGAQEGGYIDGSGGMLSMVMGPKGPMNIRTRMGGELVG